MRVVLPVCLAVLFFLAATGGIGLFVPRIHGLSGAGDYYGVRTIVAIVIVVLLAPLLVTGFLNRASPFGMVCLWVPVAFASSVGMNTALGQDPILAELNYRAPLIDFGSIAPGTEGEGCYGIENHEWLRLDDSTGRYFVGGPGIREPLWLRNRAG